MSGSEMSVHTPTHDRQDERSGGEPEHQDLGLPAGPQFTPSVGWWQRAVSRSGLSAPAQLAAMHVASWLPPRGWSLDDPTKRPSIDAIMSYFPQSRSQLYSGLADLVAAGWLHRTPGGRGRGPTIYRIVLPVGSDAEAAWWQHVEARKQRARGQLAERARRRPPQRCRDEHEDQEAKEPQRKGSDSRSHVLPRPTGSAAPPPKPPSSTSDGATSGNSVGGGQEQQEQAQTAAERVREALEAATRPLPHRDRRLCRRSASLLAELRRAVGRGWSPSKVRQATIVAYDERGLPWPDGGAAHPGGLLRWRLTAALEEEDQGAADGSGRPRPPEESPECAECQGTGTVIPEDRLVVEPCSQCREVDPAPKGGVPSWPSPDRSRAA